MKSIISKLIFITTTFLLIASIPLATFAYTIQTYAPSYGVITCMGLDTDGNKSLTEYTLPVLQPSDFPTTLDTSWVIVDGRTTAQRQYPYYYSFWHTVPSNTSIDTEGTIYCNYQLTNLDGFNSIAFNCGVFAPRYDYEFYNDFSIYINDQPVDVDYTVTYEYGDQYTNIVNGQAMVWRSVKLYFYFDQIYNYDTADVKIYVNTYLPYANGQVRYCFGMSDLIAKVVTQEEYVAEISQNIVNLGTKVDQTNTQLGVIGDTAEEIKSEVSEIVDVLTQELTPEQQEKVDTVIDSIETRAEVEDAVIEDVSSIFESFENIDYDPFDNTYKDAYTGAVDPLWESPFSVFWTAFWMDPTVMTFILIVLGFSIGGFVLYGVR